MPLLRIDIELIDAAQAGKLKLVESLLQQGANPNATDTFGFTPFSEACENGHVDLAKFLIKKRVNVNTCNVFDRTPLHGACRNRHIGIVKLLIKQGFTVDGTALGEAYYKDPINSEPVKPLIGIALWQTPDMKKPEFIQNHEDLSSVWDDCCQAIAKFKNTSLSTYSLWDVLTATKAFFNTKSLDALNQMAAEIAVYIDRPLSEHYKEKVLRTGKIINQKRVANDEMSVNANIDFLTVPHIAENVIRRLPNVTQRSFITAFFQPETNFTLANGQIAVEKNPNTPIMREQYRSAGR